MNPSLNKPKATDEAEDLFAQLQGDSLAPPSAEISSAIRAQVTTDLSPTRSPSRRLRLGMCMLLAVAVTLSLLLLRSVTHGLTMQPHHLLGAGSWVLAIALVMWLSLGRPQANTLLLRWGLAVGLPLAFIGYLNASSDDWLPLIEFLNGNGYRAPALRCSLLSLGLGTLCAGGMLYIWRGTDPFKPELTGAIAGLAGGLAGALAIGLVCPSTEGWHLLFGHGLTLALLVLLGGAVGRRVLAP